LQPSVTKRLERLHQLSVIDGGGAERAVALIELWLETGYEHLDTIDRQLPYLVSSGWDIPLIILIFVWIVFCIFRRCWKAFRPSERSKEKVL
jgi:hypothetical protein